MRYRLLGHTGCKVSELCLGTMTFGDNWDLGADERESRAVFDAYAEAGGNFLDTADLYTAGTSEEFLGRFMAGERDRWVLATKYTNHMADANPNAAGNSRFHMVRAVEDSLRRLDTDRIDLYYLHIWDFTTRPEEVMRGLEDLVRSGKVVYIGISDTPAWLVSRCNTLAELRGWERFAALQIEYSLVERTPERDLLPLARADDMSVCTWSPLASGLLSGKYTRDGSETGRRKVTESRRYTDRNLAIARTVDAIADEIGASSAQVALAWQRQHDPRALPIIGARTLDQLRDNLGCLHIRLGDDHMQRLAEVSAIELGFPHDFLRGDAVRTFTTAGCADQVDNHRPLG